MKFTRLTIKNYRKFADLSLNFVDGINVIGGKNEAGKSTISSAILDCLYADPSTRAKSFLERAFPWSGARDVQLALEFEAGSSRYLLEKDFNKRTARLTNLDTKKVSESISEIEKYIADFTGIQLRDIYESTAFVKQSEVAAIETSGDFVNAVQRIVTANKEINVQRIIKNLDLEIKALRVGLDHPAKSPGPIKRTLDAIIHLQSELNAKKPLWEKSTKASKDAKEGKAKLAELDNKIVEIEQLINNHKQREEAEKKLKDLDARLTDLETMLAEAKELSLEKDRLLRQAVKFAPFKNVKLEDVARELTENSEAVRLANSELAKFELPQKKSESRQVQANINDFILPGTALMLGVVLAVALSSVVIAVVGLLVAIASYLFLRVNKSQMAASAADEHSQLLQVKQSLEERSRQAQEQLSITLKKFKLSSPEEFYTLKAEFSSLKESLSEVESRLKGMLSGKTLNEIKEQQVRFLKQKKEIEVNELTDVVRMAKLTPEEYLRKRRELDLIYLEKKRLEEKTTLSKVRADEGQVSVDDIVLLEEQLEAAQVQKQFLERSVLVKQMVIKGLSEAIKGTARDANKLVSKYIEQYLGRITNKRYSEARINEDLAVQVFSPEKNDWVYPDSVLSKGTVDQIYFLTRLAFAAAILEDKLVPIILDDPFVTFDDDRLAQTKLILEEIAEKYQIILLSHNMVYEDWGTSIKSV